MFISLSFCELYDTFKPQVLQASLLKRNVELEWYNSSDTSTNSNNDQKIIIGYIINEERRFLFFKRSRHWYTITRLRRVSIERLIPNSDENENDKNGDNNSSINDESFNKVYLDEKTGNNANYRTGQWHIIDSEMDSINDLNSDVELNDFLTQVERNGGNVLRAVLNL